MDLLKRIKLNLLWRREFARISGELDCYAEHELRAYMGELSDSPSPVCLSLLKLARASLGRRARATPHFYAGRIIFMRLAQLIAPKTGELVPTSPAVLLDRLCAMSDSDVRAKLADVWMWLYGVPRAAAVRQSS